MSNKNDLESYEIRRGVVYADPDAIRRTRENGKSNKAHVKEESPFKSFVQKLALTGLVITLGYLAIQGALYTGERDELYRNREDQYVPNLESIIKSYSEADIINLANATIEKITTKHGPEEDIAYLNKNLAEIEFLKSQGRGNEIGGALSAICSIASRHDIFLPGYDYTMPSFPEYVFDKTLGK